MNIELNQWELGYIIQALIDKIADLEDVITNEINANDGTTLKIFKRQRENLEAIKTKLQAKLLQSDGG